MYIYPDVMYISHLNHLVYVSKAEDIKRHFDNQHKDYIQYSKNHDWYSTKLCCSIYKLPYKVISVGY